MGKKLEDRSQKLEGRSFDSAKGDKNKEKGVYMDNVWQKEEQCPKCEAVAVYTLTECNTDRICLSCENKWHSANIAHLSLDSDVEALKKRLENLGADYIIVPRESDVEFLLPGAGIIRTYTGIDINVLDPQPEQICIEDIAHALSNLCRFGGHTARPYNVAEHSLKCTELVDKQHKLAALLHDASEAYLVDVPSPIKILLPVYINIEDRLMRVIAEKFGFEYPLHHKVKAADKKCLDLEWHNLMLENNWATLDHKAARALFLKTFDELTNK